MEKLVKLVQEATDALHKAGERQDDEAKKFGVATTETKATIEKINTDITARLDAMELKYQRQSLPAPGSPDAKTEEEKARSAAFYKWMRGGKTALEPSERKALVETAAGLYLVPEDLEAEIIRELPKISVMRKLAGKRSTNRDKVSRRTLTEVSVGWGKLEIGGDITETTLVPTKPTMYVEDLYGLTKVGEDELQDTDANLRAIIADSFARAIAEAEDTAFTIGTGHDDQEPEGIAVDATLKASYKTDLATADTIIPDDLLKCEYALPAQYLAGASWLMHRKSELAVRLVKDTVAGAYMWQPSLLLGQPNNFDGFPIFNQADMNYPADTIDEATVVVFGNFNAGYRIIDRQGITLQRLDELYAEAGLVGFKVHFRVGGGIVRHAAFQTLNNEST